jgi:tryptophan 2,3-dioxygenase
MTTEYGADAPLSYNKYLAVPELVALQRCLSNPVHHDELLFITIHQVYELWFKQILHEVDQAIRLLDEDRLAAATRCLQRVVHIEQVLVNQIHVLESMTPIDFLAFRDQLNPASGFQSLQFREIEFSSGLKDPVILAEFRDDAFAAPRLHATLDQRWAKPFMRACGAEGLPLRRTMSTSRLKSVPSATASERVPCSRS